MENDVQQFLFNKIRSVTRYQGIHLSKRWFSMGVARIRHLVKLSNQFASSHPLLVELPFPLQLAFISGPSDELKYNAF